MNALLIAVSFLTRIPVRTRKAVAASDVARSAGFFPGVGAALGFICWLVAALLKGHFPPLLIAGVIVLLDAVLTGGLHLDGLADSADGFGGGRNPEQVLNIMHDHCIGSFGGIALAVCIVVKVAAYAALLERDDSIRGLVIAPMLGRLSTLILTASFRYAGMRPSVTVGMGKIELAIGTALTVSVIALLFSLQALIAVVAVVVVTICFGLYCRRRVGGITGDTLGANVEFSECASLLVFLWTR